jgi:hypothetical protein
MDDAFASIDGALRASRSASLGSENGEGSGLVVMVGVAIVVGSA